MSVEAIIHIYNRAQDHITNPKLRREDGKYITRFYGGLQDACKLVVSSFGGELKLKKNHLVSITKMTPPDDFNYLVSQYNEFFEKADKISNSPDFDSCGDGYSRGYSYSILYIMECLGYMPVFKSEVTFKNLMGFRRKNDENVS